MNVIDRADGVYTIEGHVRMPGMLLPARSTALRLKDGSFALLSPLPRLQPMKEQIEQRGSVAALVSPNLYHHLGLPRAKETFPDAKVLAPRGLEKKQPAVHVDAWLDEPVPLFEDTIDVIPLEGVRSNLREVTFFHRPSRTLVVTDLFFHINEHDAWLARALLRLNGSWRRFGISRVMRFEIKDKKALRRSADRLLALSPARVVMAHGDVVEDDAAGRLASAIAWL